MINFPKSGTVAVAAGGAVLFALALSGTAQAVTDTIFKYSSAKTAYFGLPAPAFVPNSSLNDYYGTGKYITAFSNVVTCFSAPVNLPNAAQMGAMTIWYSSVVGWGSFSIALVRNKLSDGSDETILSEQPATSNGVYHQASFPIAGELQKVNNPNYVYRVDVCLSGSSTIDPKFYSARITYTYTNAGD